MPPHLASFSSIFSPQFEESWMKEDPPKRLISPFPNQIAERHRAIFVYSDDLNQSPRAECNSSGGHPEGLLGDRPPTVVGLTMLFFAVSQ